MSGPERFAGGEAARPSERGRCPRQEQRPAGSCTAPAPAAPARPPSAARRCLPSIPPVYSILSRPVPSHPKPPGPPLGAAGAAALLTRPAPAAGGQRRRPGLLARRRRPDLYPPRGSVVRGRGGPGQPHSPYLVAPAVPSGRAAMNGAGPAPARRGRPAHVRQARGSAAPAAAWPNREPSAAPGGQGRRAGAARGREGAAARLGPGVSTRRCPAGCGASSSWCSGLAEGAREAARVFSPPAFHFSIEKKRPVELLFNQRVIRLLRCQQLRLLSCMGAASALLCCLRKEQCTLNFF